MVEQRRQRFKGKSPNELISMHKANFAIYYSDVVSVKIKKDFFGAKLEFKFIYQTGAEKVQVFIREEAI